MVNADEDGARMVIRNVIENAGKYSRTTVNVAVRIAPAGGAEIQVSDSCGGLTDDELERMFLPQYRGTPSRSRQGLGMGLYLTARICDSIGWTIAIENHVGDGCTFSVGIPGATLGG